MCQEAKEYLVPYETTYYSRLLLPEISAIARQVLGGVAQATSHKGEITVRGAGETIVVNVVARMTGPTTETLVMIVNSSYGLESWAKALFESLSLEHYRNSVRTAGWPEAPLFSENRFSRLEIEFN